MKKRLRKKVTLFKTDYEKGRLQATPAGHPQLATPRANPFLLVYVIFHFIVSLSANKKLCTYDIFNLMIYMQYIDDIVNLETLRVLKQSISENKISYPQKKKNS
jgi:hypothetical protein